MRRLSWPEARVDEVLALLGHVVFGVFRQVAQGHRLLDFGGQFVRELMLELRDFLLKLVLDVFGHPCSVAARRGFSVRERLKNLKFHYTRWGGSGAEIRDRGSGQNRAPPVI